MRRLPYGVRVAGVAALLAGLFALGTHQGEVADAAIAERTRALNASEPQREAMETLYRQALQHGEDQVVVYQAAMDYEWQPLWARFSQVFPGIRVTYMHLSPTGVTDRLDIEKVTGAHYGDVISQPVNVVLDIAARGYLERWTPPTSAALDSRWKYRDQVYFTFNKVYGLGYSTRRVEGEALPTDISQLLTGQWRNAFEYGAPGGGAGTTDVALVQLLHQQRIDFGQLRELRDQGGAGGAQEAGVISLAQGRRALNPWAYLPPLLRQQQLGVPVAIDYPPDFTLLVPFGQGLVSQPAHPNAARLLLTWLMSPDAQALLASETYALGNMPGAPLPPGLPAAAAEHARQVMLAPEETARGLKEWVPKLRSLWQQTL
ncbi:ABC transporter substrate-binding protein [Pseudomonas monteilii]|uniref:ABC transporter substrate-binding protein n=1 Tax=Pseudomonas monteilii TaxID=76759 RepID=A0A399LY33_9PSED|nr:ABC transporter substrate-binding protein [Pseudomonas monteilii]RII74199.1 ABC transporter substrate-binding protein [Pseudomonas monteilii]